jgi:hypothetical protein
VEQGYFYYKAEKCGDKGAMGRVMKATNPGTQKSIGERLKDTPDWLSARVAIMKKVCMAKYTQNTSLREFLLSTGTSYIAEDNPNDGFWGIKMSRHSPRSKNRKNFKENNLGLILMEIRDTLS